MQGQINAYLWGNFGTQLFSNSGSAEICSGVVPKLPFCLPSIGQSLKVSIRLVLGTEKWHISFWPTYLPRRRLRGCRSHKSPSWISNYRLLWRVCSADQTCFWLEIAVEWRWNIISSRIVSSKHFLLTTLLYMSDVQSDQNYKKIFSAVRKLRGPTLVS